MVIVFNGICSVLAVLLLAGARSGPTSSGGRAASGEHVSSAIWCTNSTSPQHHWTDGSELLGEYEVHSQPRERQCTWLEEHMFCSRYPSASRLQDMDEPGCCWKRPLTGCNIARKNECLCELLGMTAPSRQLDHRSEPKILRQCIAFWPHAQQMQQHVYCSSVYSWPTEMSVFLDLILLLWHVHNATMQASRAMQQ